MTERVTFYDYPRAEQLSLLCRFAGSAVERRLPMLIAVRDAYEAAEVDGLLWTFASDAFLPHDIWRPGGPGFDDASVLIVEQVDLPAATGLSGHVMLQLAPAPLEVATRFANVVDFVDRSSDATIAEGRARFVAWRKAGLQPEYRKAEGRT
jgi:DNA polymerase-3 subunit chi